MFKVKFTRKTNFTGRNGYFNCSGLEILPLEHNSEVMLSPLTGRGDVGRCDITIPFEDIPDVIDALNKATKEHAGLFNLALKKKLSNV